MLLGLTAMLTGTEGRDKKEKKPKRVAATATAAKEKATTQTSTSSDSNGDQSHVMSAYEGPTTSPRSPKRQRRAVVIKAEQKVRIA